MLPQAPLAILVCGDPTLQKHPGHWVQDCAAAMDSAAHPRQQRRRHGTSAEEPATRHMRVSARRSGLRRPKLNYAIVVLVDREGVGLHRHLDMVLFRPLGWYSPRVPAGETSPILETALLNHFALGVGDGELGFAGPAALDQHVRTLFAACADKLHRQVNLLRLYLGRPEQRHGP